MIFKPTLNSPFLSSLDLFKAVNGTEYLSCIMDTSNSTNNLRVNGYSVKILDEENNQIFPRTADEGTFSPRRITLLKDLQKYTQLMPPEEVVGYTNLNSGLNGSDLRIPFFTKSSDRNDWSAWPTLSRNQLFIEAAGADGWVATDFNGVTIPVREGERYTWIITLYQLQENGDEVIIPTETKYYDISLASGVVLGSTNKRIQTMPSDEIYSDYYVQPVTVEGGEVQYYNPDTRQYQTTLPYNWEGVWKITEGASLAPSGNRALVKTYDATYGYVYPVEGTEGFTPQNIESADLCCFYKLGTDPTLLPTTRRVTATLPLIPWELQENPSKPGGAMGRFLYYQTEESYQNGLFPLNGYWTPASSAVSDTHTVAHTLDPQTEAIAWERTSWDNSLEKGTIGISFEGEITTSDHLYIFDCWCSNPQVQLTNYFVNGKSVRVNLIKKVGQNPSQLTFYVKYFSDAQQQSPFIAKVQQNISDATDARYLLNSQYGPSAQASDHDASQRNRHSAQNGIYSVSISRVSDASTITEDDVTYCLMEAIFVRTSDTATWGGLLSSAVYVPGAGNMQTQNYDDEGRPIDSSLAYGALGFTPIMYVAEKPVELYGWDTSSDAYLFNEDINRYGVVLKNDPGHTLFVRPNSLIAAGSRLVEKRPGVNEATDYISISHINTKYWYVSYSGSQALAARWVPDTTRYNVRAFLRQGDENPFWVYRKPTATIEVDLYNNVANYAIEHEDDTYHIPGNNITVTANYAQKQQVPWGEYYWQLLVEENGDEKILKTTPPSYDGTIFANFFGLMSGKDYRVKLHIKTQQGDESDFLSDKIQINEAETIPAVEGSGARVELDCLKGAAKIEVDSNFIRERKFRVLAAEAGLEYEDFKVRHVAEYPIHAGADEFTTNDTDQFGEEIFYVCVIDAQGNRHWALDAIEAAHQRMPLYLKDDTFWITWEGDSDRETYVAYAEGEGKLYVGLPTDFTAVKIQFFVPASFDDFVVKNETPNLLYVYRREIWPTADGESAGEQMYTPVWLGYASTDNDNSERNVITLYDYNIANGRYYEYLIYSYDSGTRETTAFTAPLRAAMSNWCVTELTPLVGSEKGITQYTVEEGNVWNFRFNLSPGVLTQAMSKQEQETLARFPAFAYGKRNYLSSSLECLLGDMAHDPVTDKPIYSDLRTTAMEYMYNATTGQWEWTPQATLMYNAGGYVEVPHEQKSSNKAVDKMEEWGRVCASSNPKLLKDAKGNKFLVQITDNSFSINEEWSGRPITTSFSFMQIGDTEGVIITRFEEHHN